jgi:hypothetical protein
MALTEEQLKLQADILASKTDSTTNPNMPYKANTTLNKGLNPDLFSGNNTKIVNAINKLATDVAVISTQANDVTNKVNEILMETSSTAGQSIWTEVKELMEKDTIIEGIRHILQGQQADKILGLSSDNVGKVLTVGEDMLGNLIIDFVDMPQGGSGGGSSEGGGGSTGDVLAEQVMYFNPARPEFTNVAEALNAALEGGGGSTGTIIWEQIVNRPDVPNKIEMTEQELVLKGNDGDISSVELISSADIDDILAELD